MFSSPKGPALPRTSARRFWRLRLLVILLGVFVLLAFAAASAYDVWRLYRHTVTATNRELFNVAHALAEQTGWTWQAVDLLLLDTARWYREDASQIPQSKIDSVLAARTAGTRVRLITIVDAQGIERHRSEGSAPPNLDVSDRDHFIAQREHTDTGLYVSEPLVSRSSGRGAIVFSRRLEDEQGQFAGEVAAIVDLDDLQQFYSTINLGLGTSTYLLRENGTLLLRNPPVPGMVGRKFATLVAAANVPAAGFSNPVDGGKQEFVAVAQVRGTALEVAVTRDRQLGLRQWRDESISVAIRTIGLTLLGVLTMVAVLRQLRHIEAGERALRESEERYALAMEGANEGHWDWDVATDRLFMSPKMKTIQGLPADSEVNTREAWLARVGVHPDDKVRLLTTFTEHLKGLTPRYECEYRVRQPGGEWCWIVSRGRCLRDEAGRPARFLGSVIDITAEKQAQMDKERLEAQLRQSQKMEAIGTLAGGIAHDFNNILGAILGYGELAHQQAVEGSALRRYLDNVMHASGRAKLLVDRILGFSRSGMGERAPVNVEFVVAETLELLQASLPEDIRLETHLHAGDAAVIGDATRLHQVVMNLCTNAMQAMAHRGGTLSVTLERAELAEARTVSRGTLAPREYARLIISDTGKGIPPEVLERIFDPFFTTKGVGEGTGLGLSLVHGIVSDLGGGIDVITSPGEGTRFEIWLPVTGETRKPALEEEREPPQGHGETVMVVDDEQTLVALSEEMLAHLGYEPVGFESSAAALRAFRAQPQRFDVIVTDEAMPELTGTDLAQEVHQLRPGLPVILVSGYGGTQLTARAATTGVSAVLRKPLRSFELAETLARVLEFESA